MKTYLLISMLLSCFATQAQKLDSLFFNLYTDSLKIGTYNYINVDGKYSDGTYLPLTDKELSFSASAGRFERNSLFIDSSFKGDKITVTASLKSNPSVTRKLDIYIKKYEPPVKLKTMDEIMSPTGKSRSKGRHRSE